MVTVSDVRQFLKDLPIDFVSDEAIQKQIELAQFIVSHENGGYATSDEIEKATLVAAAYYTALAYASEVERSLNVLPPSLINWLDLLKQAYERVLEYIRSGVPPFPVNLITLVADCSESLIDYLSGGDP